MCNLSRIESQKGMHFNHSSQVVPQRVAADIVSWNPAQTFGTSFVITTPSEHLKAFQQCFKSAWRMALLSSASGAPELVCQDTLSTLSLCWRSILLVDSKHLTAKRSLSAKMAQMLWTQMDVPLRCFGQTNVVLVSVNRVFLAVTEMTLAHKHCTCHVCCYSDIS